MAILYKEIQALSLLMDDPQNSDEKLISRSTTQDP